MIFQSALDSAPIHSDDVLNNTRGPHEDSAAVIRVDGRFYSYCTWLDHHRRQHDDALLKLTLRSYSPMVRKLLSTECSAWPARSRPLPMHLNRRSACFPEPRRWCRTRRWQIPTLIFERAFGKQFERLPDSATPSSTCQDFSKIVETGIPSRFFGVGAYDPAVIATAQAQDKSVPSNHSSLFAPSPEPTIGAPAKALSLAVVMIARGTRSGPTH